MVAERRPKEKPVLFIKACSWGLSISFARAKLLSYVKSFIPVKKFFTIHYLESEDIEVKLHSTSVIRVSSYKGQLVKILAKIGVSISIWLVKLSRIRVTNLHLTTTLFGHKIISAFENDISWFFSWKVYSAMSKLDGKYKSMY